MHAGLLAGHDQNQIQFRRNDERSKVAVSRQKRDATVEAALRDHRASQSCLPSFGQDAGTQQSSALPVSIFQFDQWDLQKQIYHFAVEARTAEQLGQDHGRHQELTVFQSPVQQVNVLAGGATKKGDPRTRIRRDQRSSFSSTKVLEKRTWPRSSRNLA